MKLAIIGTGGAAAMNVRAARLVKGLELAAVYSSDSDRGEQFALRYETTYVKEIQEIAEDSEIDVVIIATTPDKHRPQLEQLLNHKSIIFVEKPFALNVKEAKQMVELIKKSNSFVSVLYKHRFDDAFTAIKNLVRAGDLGQILNVNFTMSEFRNNAYIKEHNRWRDSPDRAGGGVLLQLGIHWINFLFGIFGYGAEIKKTAIFKKKGRKLEDFVSIQFSHNMGFVGNLTFSRLTASLPAQLEILGKKASLRYEVPYLQIYHPNYSKSLKVVDLFFNKLSRRLPVSIKKQRSLRTGGNNEVIKYVLEKYKKNQSKSFLVEEAIKDQEFIEKAIAKSKDSTEIIN